MRKLTQFVAITALLLAASNTQLAFANNTPSISKVSGKITVGQRSSLRIEGKSFDPATVEVVVFGGKCTQGCVVPNDVLDEDGGAITETLLGAVPVTINHAGKFEVAVRNGPNGTLSNRANFTVK